jgi:hypothetical protein
LFPLSPLGRGRGEGLFLEEELGLVEGFGGEVGEAGSGVEIGSSRSASSPATIGFRPPSGS